MAVGDARMSSVSRFWMAIALGLAIAACDRGDASSSDPGQSAEVASSEAAIEFERLASTAYAAGFRAGRDRETAAGVLNFRRTPEVTNQVAERLANELTHERTVPPALVEHVRSGRAVGNFSAQARKYGLDPDNLADVAAMYQAVGESIVRGHPVSDDLLAQQRDRWRASLIGDPYIGTASDVQKQAVADRYAMLTEIYATAYVRLLRANDREGLIDLQREVAARLERVAD